MGMGTPPLLFARSSVVYADRERRPRPLPRAGGAWTAEPTGLDEKAILWGLWGSSATDLWAVGGQLTSRPLNQGVITFSGSSAVTPPE